MDADAQGCLRFSSMAYGMPGMALPHRADRGSLRGLLLEPVTACAPRAMS